MSAAVAVTSPVRRTSGGRTLVTARALEQVVAAVAGEALGVPGAGVHVALTDRGGDLDVVARAPMRVIAIRRLRLEPGALARAGGTVLERCAAAEDRIRSDVHRITGYTVHHVTVHLTDVELRRERRVR